MSNGSELIDLIHENMDYWNLAYIVGPAEGLWHLVMRAYTRSFNIPRDVQYQIQDMLHKAKDVAADAINCAIEGNGAKATSLINEAYRILKLSMKRLEKLEREARK